MRFGVTDKKQAQLETRMAACGIVESDLEETFIRSSGPGGQNTNKTNTAVRLVHKPTCLEVKCSKTRSQLMNRFYARRQLCDLIELQTLGNNSPRRAEEEKIRKQKQRRKRRAKK
jgi:protein subunit release factor B